MGRPTSLTPQVAEKILTAIRKGNYKSTACAAAGIPRSSLHNWEQRAETGEEPYSSFIDEMRQAEAEAEMALQEEIRNAKPAITGVCGPDPWTSRAWIMERRWPNKWSGRVKVTVNEEIDSLTKKLARDPELHRRVLHVLSDEEPAADGSNGHEPH